MPRDDSAQPEPIDKSSGKHRDFIIISVLGAILVGAFILLTFKLIDQEDRHVREVEKVRMAEGFTTYVIVHDEAEQSVDGLLNKQKKPREVDLSTLAITDQLLKRVGTVKTIEKLVLSHTKVTDKGLEYITELPLVELDLSGTVVTDSCLSDVAKIPTLSKVDLASTRVTDSGLSTLRSLPKLVSIDLSNTTVTDEGIQTLLSFKALERLSLSGTRITDSGLASISKLPILNTLFLENTNITGPGIRKNLRAKAVRKADLGGCNLHDSDVGSIAVAFPALTILNMDSTRLTDAGLLKLAEIGRLRSLKIRRVSTISSEGVKEFQRINPRCKIETSIMSDHLIPSAGEL